MPPMISVAYLKINLHMILWNIDWFRHYWLSDVFLVPGWLYDLSGSYSVAFYVAGGFMAAGVCLMFLIPFCAEDDVESRDVDQILITDETETSKNDLIADKLERISEENSSDNTFILLPKTDDKKSSVLAKSKSRLCITPCLPPHGHLGVEEGSYCKEEDGDDIAPVEKISVIWF